MNEKEFCASCNQRITNVQGTTTFPCPKCAKSTIVRCKHCREIVAKYHCPSCGFVGPN